ncbi:carboxymuconolactone decarboxylase family protein [Cellulomonas sp. Marseille-Q8402]
MDGTTRVPAAEITGLYGAVLKRLATKMLGQVPDSAGVMWHNRRVLKDMMGFSRKADGWDRLDPDVATFAVMAAAGTVGCSFCLDLNYFMAHSSGRDEARVREVPRWRTSDVFTATERRVMEYAEAMSRTPPEVTDDLVAALLTDLGPAALVELTAKVGMMNAGARTNIALGITSQGFSDSCGMPALASPA